MRTLDREYFMSLHLNTKNRLTAVETVAVGTLNASLLHPREVFKGAMLNNASSLIVAHNHPSGDPKPGPCYSRTPNATP
jgi:DNA repair protein RadC